MDNFEMYPVLVGFEKAILPDNDVVVNLESKAYNELYEGILLPSSSFVSINKVSGDVESQVGTLVKINTIKANPRNYTLICHSIARVKLLNLDTSKKVLYASIAINPYEIDCDDLTITAYGEIIDGNIEKLKKSKDTHNLFKEIPQFSKDDPNLWINKFAAAFEPIDINQLFYAVGLEARLETVAIASGRMLDKSTLIAEIKEKVQNSMEKNQREYYLREEMKVINEELYGSESEKDKYIAKIDALDASAEVKERLHAELDKMVMLQVGSPESFVSKNYIDTVISLPWGKFSEESLDIAAAKKILDDDHFGIDDVKDRVIEYLAVHALNKTNSTNILCLVGPPGVGKTSIAESIARAIGRKYVRVSLGGVRDEAEIRGHRRTYLGSMPGRIITGMKKAGTMNPVFLLDEIDKLGADYKGDPSNALLEVLDPQQNSTFQDHYIDLPFDLSNVMFITTANSLQGMARPLLDRMEIIELGSYMQEEKVEIARRFLVPKQQLKHSLSPRSFVLTDDAINSIITGYTRESGVRKLEQNIAKICRKIAVKVVSGINDVVINASDVEEYLGIPKFEGWDVDKTNKIGVAHGLAWTEAGGEMLDIECLVLPGNDKRIVTGNLGAVMKESVEIAISNARRYISKNGDVCDLSEKDIHVHAPEGAVPKDGPSAGCAISVAVLSSLLKAPVKGDIALTGELSLCGDVLPIGGVKEKCLAAYRNGVETIILPRKNKKDIVDIPVHLRDKINFVFVSRIEEIYDAMLIR